MNALTIDLVNIVGVMENVFNLKIFYSYMVAKNYRLNVVLNVVIKVIIYN